jgi:hypothetical protein
MPSIGGKRAVSLTRLCAFAGALLALSGCHRSSEEDLWASCCLLSIVKDRSAIAEGPKTIIAWQRETRFRGNGSALDGVGRGRIGESWKKEWIQADLAAFLAGNPERPAAAYFLGLGMSCMTRAGSSKDAATRCEIELPVWIECRTATIFLNWGPSVPKELRQPMLAHLRMSIDVSAEAVLDVSTRIDAVPGGHLCHR